MRAVRIASITALLLVAVVATGMAQDRINTPGVYEMNACILPALLNPPSLGTGLFEVGPDFYYGEVTIELLFDGTYSVQFKGRRADGAQGKANAIFGPDWAGIKTGPLPYNGGTEMNCITGIDIANLLEANVNGVGHVYGEMYRYIAKFGYQGEILQQKVVPAPAIYR